jgi:hypothetical protein
MNQETLDVLPGQPITHADLATLPEGMLIVAICEDDQTHIGILMRKCDSTPVLVPLSTEIPIGTKRPYRKRVQE